MRRPRLDTEGPSPGRAPGLHRGRSEGYQTGTMCLIVRPTQNCAPSAGRALALEDRSCTEPPWLGVEVV